MRGRNIDPAEWETRVTSPPIDSSISGMSTHLNHISARVRVTDRYLLNPFGMMYGNHRILADQVDLNGKIIANSISLQDQPLVT
jgi:hypothetical protein